MPLTMFYNAALNGVALVDLADQDTVTTDRLPYHYRLHCLVDLDDVLSEIGHVIDSNTNSVYAAADTFLKMSGCWSAIKTAEPMSASATSSAPEDIWRQALCRLIESTDTASSTVNGSMESLIADVAESDDLLGSATEKSGRDLFRHRLTASASGTSLSVDAAVDASVTAALAASTEVRIYGIGVAGGITLSAESGTTLTSSDTINLAAGQYIYLEIETGVDSTTSTTTGAISGNRTSTWEDVVDSVRYGDSRRGEGITGAAGAGAGAGGTGARGDIALSQEYASALVRQAWRAGRIDDTSDTASGATATGDYDAANSSGTQMEVTNVSGTIAVGMIVNVPGADNNASGSNNGGGQNTFVEAVSGTTLTLSAAPLTAPADGAAIVFTTPGIRADNFAMQQLQAAGESTANRLAGGDRFCVTFKVTAEAAGSETYNNTFGDGNALKFQSNPAGASSVANTLMIRVELVHNTENTADAGATSSSTPTQEGADVEGAMTNDTGDV